MRIAIRAAGFALAFFFMLLALSLAREGIAIAFFFMDSGVRDVSAMVWGSVTLLYAAVFAAASLLVISSDSHPRLWVVLAALAFPMLALTAISNFLARPLGAWVFAGFVLILAFAAVRTDRRHTLYDK